MRLCGAVAVLGALASGLDVRAASNETGACFRILYWNIQNGMWDGQRDGYARFVDFVRVYDPQFLSHDFMLTTGLRDVIDAFHPGRLIPSCAAPRRIDFVYMTPPLLACVRRADILATDYTKPVRAPEGKFFIPSDHLPILIDRELE